jgi:hypothetical protein
MAWPPLPWSCGKATSAAWRIDSYHQTLCRLSHTFLRYRPFRLSTLDPRLPQEGGEFQIRLARLLPGILSTVLARPAQRARTPFLGCHNDPSIDPRAPSTCHCVRTAGKSWKGPGHNTGKGVVLISRVRCRNRQLERRQCRAAEASGEVERVASLLDGALNSQNPTGRLHSEALGCMLSGGRKLKRGDSGLLGFRPSRHRVSQGLVIPASSHLA